MESVRELDTIRPVMVGTIQISMDHMAAGTGHVFVACTSGFGTGSLWAKLARHLRHETGDVAVGSRCRCPIVARASAL